jgi:5'-nucleotidase
MRLPLARALLLLLLALLAAAARPEELPPSRASAPLTILQLNDVYTIRQLDGGKAGGLGRVATLKKQLAAPGRTVLLVLAGDFLSPSVASGIFQGKQMVATLNAIGLDLATLGNHEFDFGPAVLRQRMAEAKWRWVVANVLDEATGKPVGGAAPYLIRQYGPLKVGFFGLCINTDVIAPERLQGLKLLDPLATAAQVVPELKRQGADTIVALTHLDFSDDHRLAERFPEIDLIVGGHEHVPITAAVNRALISKTGMNARYAGRIDLNRAPAGTELERFFELIPITDQLPDDPAAARVVADYETQLNKALDVVIGATRVPLEALEADVRNRETNLGNYIADVMRAAVGADLAILNGGAIRSDQTYPAGPLQLRDLEAIMPFGDITCKVAVTGATVLAALNHGVTGVGQGMGAFPQVSGVTFTVDPKAPPGQQVRDLRVGGQPLDPNKQYTVALLDYAVEGGDGYTMWATGKELVSPETGSLLVGQLEAAIRRQGTIAPQVEGRIRIEGAPQQRTGSTVHRRDAENSEKAFWTGTGTIRSRAAGRPPLCHPFHAGSPFQYALSASSASLR